MKKFLFILLSLAHVYCFASLKEPYNKIKLLPAKNHGWFWNPTQLSDIFENHKIETVVEVGSWLGCSTTHIARLLPENGKVYAVDHWQGSIEHQGMSDCKKMLPTLYEQFLSNIIHAKLTDKVIPIRKPSYEAALSFNEKVDLIYIDAAHDEMNVFQDLYVWYPKLKKNGIMCGDDWLCGSVRLAVKKFAKVNNIEVFFDHNFWYFKPKTR